MGPQQEDRERWQAVLARDIRSDGCFVYAVNSTGVYCRPSCPSRRPHPRHVVFYPTPAAAERAGFRACRRCHPRVFEELLEKRRMEEELKLASAIQSRLRPSAWPALEGWQLAGVSLPCREIGGDYYDCFERAKDGRVILALGDVAGKGADAALLMSSLHACVRAQARVAASLNEVMREINQYVYENTPPEKFVTLFYAELDPPSGSLRYSNAGHPPPLVVRRSGEVVRLEAGGIPVGILSRVLYGQGEVALDPGDVLILYSDGISESLNGDKEFGESPLIEAARQNPECAAGELRDRIGEALERFAGAAPPADDRSLVVVKRMEIARAEIHAAVAPESSLSLVIPSPPRRARDLLVGPRVKQQVPRPQSGIGMTMG